MNANFGFLLAVIAAIAWGMVVIPIKGSKIPSYIGTAISMPAGILTLLLATLLFKVNYIHIPNLLSPIGLLLLLAGVFQFTLATTFYYESIKNAELSTIIPLTRIKSIFIVILVLLCGIEKINLKIFIACLIGVLGAVVLTYQPKSKSDINNMRKGVIFALLACISWAIGDILVRFIIKSIPALLTTLLSLSIGTLIYYLWMIFKRQIRNIVEIPTKEKMRFIIHGVFSFGIAYFAFFASMQYIGIARAVIITATWPLISCIVGFTLYKEHISFRKILGALFLIGSVVLVF